MKNTRTFIKRSRINAPAEEVFKWHARPGALERLIPPWDRLKVINAKNGIAKGAKVFLKIKPGPVFLRWTAEHTEYEENRLFRDEQKEGPFALWIHTHRFEPDGTNACFLEDHIHYALSPAKIFALPFVKRRLERIFDFRHKITAMDIAGHLSYKDQRPLNILISGASGIIGTRLVPFLTTGGHKVSCLVRRNKSDKDDIFWDPDSGFLNVDDIKGTDTVIHLSGENIGKGLWTKEKKRRILESRVKSTRLIAETISKLDPLPRVLVCASAIGWYGNRSDAVLTENDSAGNDFISFVCKKWEQAAEPALKKGIRVVFMRIGVVLTPAGGALKKVLPLFKTGLGGKTGAGTQYMSWIEIDDVVRAFYHVILNNSIHGPVNVVSPNPVTNTQYTKTLSQVLVRPCIIPIPAPAIKLAFGKMGKEIVLSSTRVKPDKLLETGYVFRNPELHGALQYLLGKK